jgi:hypothetical protein
MPQVLLQQQTPWLLSTTTTTKNVIHVSDTISPVTCT